MKELNFWVYLKSLWIPSDVGYIEMNLKLSLCSGSIMFVRGFYFLHFEAILHCLWMNIYSPYLFPGKVFFHIWGHLLFSNCIT